MKTKSMVNKESEQHTYRHRCPQRAMCRSYLLRYPQARKEPYRKNHLPHSMRERLPGTPSYLFRTVWHALVFLKEKKKSCNYQLSTTVVVNVLTHEFLSSVRLSVGNFLLTTVTSDIRMVRREGAEKWWNVEESPLYFRGGVLLGFALEHELIFRVHRLWDAFGLFLLLLGSWPSRTHPSSAVKNLVAHLEDQADIFLRVGTVATANSFVFM